MKNYTSFLLAWTLVTMTAQGDVPGGNYQRDRQGDLLPAIEFPVFIKRSLDFVLKDLDAGWSAGNAYTEASGKPIPAYINYAQANGKHELGVGHELNADTVYPAFHHSLYIRTFLAQWRRTKDPECLRRAGQLADWNLERRTPADWKYGNLFYSTVHRGKVGGSVDGDSIMTDKPAIMALALLELAETSGQPRYRIAAEEVADTLANTQTPKGNWPFRVNPRTGEVRDEYTSSAIYAVMLFETLLRGNDKRWMEPRRKALKWVLENPCKTMEWRGFYEDISALQNIDNRTNWDCIDTARWLVAHRTDNPDYLPLAIQLNDWIVKNFADTTDAWAPAEGIREQKVCFATMGIHTAHWAALIADLHAATGEAAFKNRALNACALVTYWMRPDNSNSVGPTWGTETWFSCHFGPALYAGEVLGILAQDSAQ